MNEEKEAQDLLLIDGIKFKGRTIQISYRKGLTQITGEFHETPDPRFPDAMGKLRNSVTEILELPNESYRIVPFAVKFRYNNEGAFGASISSYLSLVESNQKVKIDTPFRWLDIDCKKDPKYLTAGQGDMLQNLLDEAQEYLEGHRAQTVLFNQDGSISDDQQQEEDDTPQVPMPAVAAAGNVVPFQQH